MSESTPSGKTRLRRLRRFILLILGSMAALVVLVVMAILIRPTREQLLVLGLRQAERVLPGSLSVGDAEWPTLGTLELDRVLWTDPSDTVLAVERLSLSVSLPGLLHRDLHVNHIAVEELSVQLPRLLSLFPPGSETGEEKRPSRDAFFPRSGSLPGIPSVRVERATLTAPRVILPDSTAVLGVDIHLSLDVTRNRRPWLRIARCAADSPDLGLLVGETRIDIELIEGGTIDGVSRGRLAPEWPYTLEIQRGVGEEFELTLSVGPEETALGLSIRGRLGWEEQRPQSVELRADIATPGTRDLGRIPALAPAMNGLPDLEGVQATLRVSAELQPDLAANAELDVLPTAWLERGRVAGRYAAGRTDLDTLHLGFPDLEMTAKGWIERESIDAILDVRASGTRWLDLVSPDAPLDSLALSLHTSATGRLSEPVLATHIDAGGRAGELVVDRLLLDAELPRGREGPGVVSFQLQALKHILEGEMEADLSRPFVARLTPLRVREATSEPPAEVPAGTAEIRFDPETRDLRVANLRMVGAFGNLEAEADLRALETGRIGLRWEWPDPPTPVYSLLDLPPGKRDTLELLWDEGESYHLAVEALVEKQKGVVGIEAAGDARLPGPRNLVPLLPQDAEVDDLGPVGVDFDLEFAGTPAGTEFTAGLDLSPTEWIQADRVVVRGEGSNLTLEPTSLAVDSLTIALAGSRADTVWDVSGSLELTDTALLRRFVPDLGEGDQVRLHLDGRFRGTADAPTLEATLEAQARTNLLELPRLSGRIDLTGGVGSASLTATNGLTAAEIRLDSLTVHYATEGKGFLPCLLDLDARGPQMEIYHRVHLAQEDGWTARADSLWLSVLGESLASRGPFQVRTVTSQNALLFDDLELAGELGTVSADGYADPDSVTLRADVALDLPELPPPLLDIPESIWPESVDLHIRSEHHREMTIESSVIGIALGQEHNLAARLSTHVGANQTEFTLRVGHPGRSFIVGEGALPARFQLYPVSYSVQQADLGARITIDGLPVPWELMGMESQGMLPYSLSGQLTAGGTAKKPWLATDLHLQPSDPKLDPFRLDLEALLVSANDQRTMLGDLLPETFLLLTPEALPDAQTGLTAALAMTYQGERTLHCSLAYPITWSEEGLVPDSNRSVAVHVQSDSLTLAELNPLLPAGLELGGKMNLMLDIEGPIRDPKTTGWLAAKEFSVSMAKGGRILGNIDLDFSGSARRPRVDGKIRIDNGLIPIPEAPRSLHSVRGKAMLWEIEGMAPDTVEAERTVRRKARPDTTAETMPIQPQLDVEIVVPRALWIRGRQLGVELSGRLRLVQEDRPAPTVIGVLRAERGNLNFLGRNFQVDPGGEVNFYGDDEFNPSLDVSLSARIQSYRIIVTLQGTVEDPELVLSSEPEMSEGDIMSVLVFGEPMDKLDGDQAELVARRAAAIAATYGTAELEAGLTGALPVDMLQIKPGGGGEAGSGSVTVGKYLSPKALLKYEQALDSSAGFFVSLEYLLTRVITLETLAGTRQSGAQINLIKDY